MQLEPEEASNYKIKDSIFQNRQDSAGSKHTIDSLRHRQGKVSAKKILRDGFTRSNFNPDHPVSFTWQPVFKGIQYNTVEGLNSSLEATIRKRWIKSRQQLSFTPHLRYGFSNTHLNAWGDLLYSKRTFIRDDDGGTSDRSTWTLSGGKRVSQFNKDEPITPWVNTLYTLFDRRNYMKIYENYFASLTYAKRLDNGLRVTANLLYEDRLPLNNTTDYAFIKKDSSKLFTPNYPFEKIPQQFTRHQAVIASVEIQYQPGQRYIQFPNNKMSIGSDYPTFSLAYSKGVKDILGSDVDFDKWKFSVWDDVNLKLRGVIKYRFSVGGFLNNKSVPIQDYQHFNGNQIFVASQYLNSFQLAPYYANSTTASFYAEEHTEHHFNGMLTNKIPLFRRLNWYLVGGTNAFYVNRSNNYVEAFGGIENIFKIFRVDVVASYLNGKTGEVGVRLGFGGIARWSVRQAVRWVP